MQAHESAIRSLKWAHNDAWLLSSDDTGVIKYWQSNMNNVKAIQVFLLSKTEKARSTAVKALSFCPGDEKFVLASADKTLGVWDFASCQEELRMNGMFSFFAAFF